MQTRTEELNAEKLRAEVTLSSIGDAVITTDSNGNIEFINLAAEVLTGWTLVEATGKSIDTVFHIVDEKERSPVKSPVMRCIAEEVVVGLGDHTILIGRHGKEYFIQDSAAPIWSAKQQLLGVVLVFSDVSERHRLSREATHHATHDALTGLVNRREFEARLQRALDATHLEGHAHALVYLDLDQFKVINDTSGHGAGDELLRQLSRVLEKQIRNRDTFARLGGDEFGLLMEHCSLEQAQIISEKLLASIADYRFLWEKHAFRIGASLGLVAVDTSSVNIAELLRRADAACYAAKDGGRNRIHVYRNDDVGLSQQRGEMQWVSRIQNALDDDRFHLYYQPIIALRESNLAQNQVRFEILLRMEDEQGEIILPEVFLPAAERYDLATKIDRWVVSQTLSEIMRSPSLVESMTYCAINLSGQSLADPTMAAFIEAQLNKTGIPPQKICFEVTETAAIANFSVATAMFARLQTLGSTFALDDFGAGLSSFTYLKTLAVNYLKIDGTFVTDIVDDRISYAMVKSINELGQVMGKTTIAEFAGNDAILDKLRELEVDFAQGYAVGHPMPLKGLL
ncbi:MAG: diguanylate cyclase (GGDEF)-like protein/PAS domain S-box-containing protein [Planctomycetota bacterium]